MYAIQRASTQFPTHNEHQTGYEVWGVQKDSSSKTAERVTEAIERELRAHSPDGTKLHLMHA